MEGIELSQVATTAATVSPRLVVLSRILALSSVALQELINAELAENPALEVVDAPRCHRCGAGLQRRERSVCQHCLTAPDAEARAAAREDRERAERAEERPLIRDRDDYAQEEGSSIVRRDSDDDFDPLGLVASELSLQEHLMRELGMVLRGAQLPVAEFLIGSLDERGWLTCSVEEAARALDVSPDEVAAVLRELQQQEPIGIGARDLRECLLIQLDYLETQGTTAPHVRAIVGEHLPQLGAHKLTHIARDLRISHAAVAEAARFIKRALNPFPAHGAVATSAGAAHQTGYVLPDVIITKREGGFEVDVVESRRSYLRVNALYRELLLRSRQDSQQNGDPRRTRGTLNAHERQHLQQYVSRAKLFLAAIDQRRHTVQRIVAFLVSYQGAFLEQGVRHLRPLTRQVTAAALGLHESTVSRAAADKYAMLPSRQVIPLADFFTPSLSAKDVLKDILEHETVPLTDEQLAAELAKQGVVIARRTVAKYRAQLRVLPALLR